MKTKILASFAVLTLLLSACGGYDEDADLKPEITIINPVDTFALGKFPLHLRFTDNSGLVFTDISLSKNGVVYYQERMSISGVQAQIYDSINPGTDSLLRGEHLLRVSCEDLNGNETLADTLFYLQ